MTTLLWSKTRIHRFVRRILTEVEVEDAIKFFVVAFVILPLLPDQGVGPYGVLNPAKIWLLVVLLTGIGWVGYIGVRALGPQRGLLVTGLAGGFVSATATTAWDLSGQRAATRSGRRPSKSTGSTLGKSSPVGARKAGGRKVYAPPKVTLPGRVPYEVVAAGQHFVGELQVHNVSEAELGLVLLCLGVGQAADRGTAEEHLRRDRPAARGWRGVGPAQGQAGA